MSARLPALSQAEFGLRLGAVAPGALTPVAVGALHAHYEELRRWSARMSLIGAADAEAVVERHYAEALAALPLIPPDARTLVDAGSGAGFPGVVLAAARPDLEVTLVEPRERRWAFLMAACRHAGLGCRCLRARIDLPLAPELPDSIDVVTVRALKLPPKVLAALAGRLAPDGRILFWAGDADPDLPADLRPGRSLRLPDSLSRRILEVLPAPER